MLKCRSYCELIRFFQLGHPGVENERQTSPTASYFGTPASGVVTVGKGYLDRGIHFMSPVRRIPASSRESEKQSTSSAMWWLQPWYWRNPPEAPSMFLFGTMSCGGVTLPRDKIHSDTASRWVNVASGQSRSATTGVRPLKAAAPKESGQSAAHMSVNTVNQVLFQL